MKDGDSTSLKESHSARSMNQPNIAKDRITQNIISAQEISQNNERTDWEYSSLETKLGGQSMEAARQLTEDESKPLQNQQTAITGNRVLNVKERRRVANSRICNLLITPLGIESITNKLMDKVGVSIPTFMLWTLTTTNFVLQISETLNKAIDQLTYEEFTEFARRDVKGTRLIQTIFGIKSVRQNERTRKKINHPLIERLSDVMIARGNSPSSVRCSLEIPITAFFEWLCRVYVEFTGFTPSTLPVMSITSEHVIGYRRYLKHQIQKGELKASSAEQYLRRLKTFFNFCYQQRIVKTHPMHNVKDLDSSPAELVLPTVDEVERYFEVILEYSDRPVQDFSAFLGLLSLGLRRVELAKFSWKNINAKDRLATIWRKGDRTQTLPIPKDLLECLSWMDSDSSDLVFTNNPGTFSQDLYLRYRAFELLAGWSRKTGPHVFRHLFITGLTHSDCDVRSLMYLTNHESPYILQQYSHRSTQDLKEAVNRMKIGR